MNAFLPGKSLFNPIKYYKINEDSFSIVSEGCAHGADSCRGQRADLLELKFINEKYSWFYLQHGWNFNYYWTVLHICDNFILGNVN